MQPTVDLQKALPSPVGQQIFCIIGGGFVGVSTLLRLAALADIRPT
ncbi:hypothetical protein OIV19_22730 [Brucella sp. HL-2]|nr:hypothetical protein [Brucella sp. HL-2]MCV9910402.1 hypothetical protein [Brucella sp. HL-2]